VPSKNHNTDGGLRSTIGPEVSYAGIHDVEEVVDRQPA